MARAIGIDLGTYNSAAAVALGRNRIAMIESKYGKTLYGKSFPSFVLFDHHGRKQVVGQRAREELSINPKLVVWGVKRLVGLSFAAALESGELKRFEYDIEEGPGGGILIKVGDERFSPSHILEFILREIKEDAENSQVNPLLGGVIDKAIISIPAYFKAIRTAPIIEAARHAGFEEVDTIAEPTAASIDYCVDVENEANLLAFDIGAGTLDVTVMLVINEQGELIPGELCTSGHEALGGIDMDDALIAHMIDRHDLRGIETDPGLMAILKEEVEKAKIRLSTREMTAVDLPGDQTVQLTRGELEETLAPLLDKCRGPIRVALRQAGVDPSRLDKVLFIGGPSNMPCIRRLVAEELQSLGVAAGLVEEITASGDEGLPVDPMECVARGAALKAGKIVEPVGKVIAEGYGTIYGPVEDNLDYYEPIIKENSHYPISGTALLSHGNPGALEVPIALVSKRPDVERSSEEKTVYKYEYLGNYTLGITPQRRLPSIEIQLKVTDDKRVVANLIHTQTRQQVRYEGLDLLKGQEMDLQEHTAPAMWRQHDLEMLSETVTSRRGSWTKSHLEHHLHVAREALALVKDASHEKLARAIREVEQAIGRAVESDSADPNEDCPNISNRTKELLDTLRQPGIAQISNDDFRRYLEQLIKIAQMVAQE
jgi:molecular chaperone DnaK